MEIKNIVEPTNEQNYGKNENQQSARRPHAHRYSVPEFATWQTIVEQNDKDFAVDASTNRIVSLKPKAAKVGGLYLTLGGVAVKPTDAVDAKKEYTLAYIAPQPEPTPVTPE